MIDISGIYEVHDTRFKALIIPHAVPVKIADGILWGEGPVWFAEHDCLIWSDIPNDKMWRYLPGLGTAVFRAPSNFSNGNTRDRQGRLVTCEHGTRRVTRTQPDGTIEVIADAFEGRKLNSPNDVVVAADDAIWFTDSSYGILTDYVGHKAQPEYDGCYVFRVDPITRRVDAMLTDFVMPDGIAFSPKGDRLYVSDSGFSHDPRAPHHVRVFTVTDGKHLSDGRIFADIKPGIPDGLRVDIQGNVWICAKDGIQVFDAEGSFLGKIKLPATASNLCFGGARYDRLFITATDSVWTVAVNIQGARRP